MDFWHPLLANFDLHELFDYFLSQNNVLKSLIKHSRIPKILLTLMSLHNGQPTLTQYNKNSKNFHKNAISFQKSSLFLDKAFHSRYFNFYVWNLWYKNCSWNILFIFQQNPLKSLMCFQWFIRENWFLKIWFSAFCLVLFFLRVFQKQSFHWKFKFNLFWAFFYFIWSHSVHYAWSWT